MTDTAPCIAEGEHIKTQRHLPASCPMTDFDSAEAAGFDGTLRSGTIAEQAAATEQRRCNWCGVKISQEGPDVWLDAMDDAHCDKNGDDGHQPEPTVRDFWQDGSRGMQTLDTTITPTKDSPVSMTWRAVLAADLVNSTGEPVTYRVEFYRTYHAAGTNVPEDGPWFLTGEARTGWTTEDAAMTWAEKEEHADAWDFDNDQLYAAKVEQVTAVQQATAARDDRQALDDIAALLGTPETWDGAADFLDSIAAILARTNRPGGSLSGKAWLRAFEEHTGRPYVGGYDLSED